MKINKTFKAFLISLVIFGCSNDGNETNNPNELITCEGDVILKSQEEINSFANNGCQKIIGSLTIDDTGSNNDENADIFDLGPLNKIVEVTESVFIINNPNITNINALNNINKIGKFFMIQINESLVEINGFNNLEKIGSNLSIYTNKNLLKISGFNKLKRITDNEENIYDGDMEISFNVNLGEINGFSQLESISIFHIRGNESLKKLIGFNNLIETGDFRLVNPITEMNAFQNLKKVNGDFTFWLTKLPNMNNFSNLETVEGRLWLDYNHQLKNLYGLENLSVIGGELRIGYFEGNSNLENINGLIGLNSASIVHFQNNHSLNTLDGLDNLTNNTYEIEIWSNDNLNNFCAITNLVKSINSDNVSIFSNMYNPTISDFENGNCNQ
jgi:hypothetical protein